MVEEYTIAESSSSSDEEREVVGKRPAAVKQPRYRISRPSPSSDQEGEDDQRQEEGEAVAEDEVPAQSKVDKVLDILATPPPGNEGMQQELALSPDEDTARAAAVRGVRSGRQRGKGSA